MKRIWIGLSTPVLLLLGAWYMWPTLPPLVEGPLDLEPVFESKVRGLSWERKDSVQISHLQTMQAVHANWMAHTPFGWQYAENTPEIAFRHRRDRNGRRERELVRTAKLARTLGIKSMLKPHIWIRRPNEGKWRSDIDMQSPEDWEKWFADYKAFILHYAQIAEKHQFEAFCIGTELYIPSTQHEQEWREIIAAVREVYHGKLTYAANFYLEYEGIQFWDALDFIGVQAYFPLVERKDPSLKALKKAWEPHFRRLKLMAKKWQKPLVFTEVGYRSSMDAAIHPWEWEPRGEIPKEEISAKVQARCYQAMFERFWDEDWMEGVFIWKWSRENYMSKEAGYRPRRTPSPVSFAPKEEAVKVLTKWFQP